MIAITAQRPLRGAALADLVLVAEQAHQHSVSVHGDDAPTRQAAIVAVLDEASAYWQVESRGGDELRTLDDVRELADAMRRDITEQAPSIVAALVAAPARARAFAAVAADLRGAGDDD